MAGRSSQIENVAAMSRVTAQTELQAESLRQHLGEILSSPAFKGSRRSHDFLQHIIDKALTGQFEDLKERAIGVELFGRAVDYDTGGDAIVRVTASDVRRRLLHFYSEFGVVSNTKIELPPGSYIPEFRHAPEVEITPEPQIQPQPQVQIDQPSLIVAPRVTAPEQPRSRSWIAFVLVAASLLACVLWFAVHPAFTVATSSDVQPWNAMLRPDHQTRIVLCDPDISKVQGLFDFRISLSDYANHRYLPERLAPGPDLQRVVQTLRGTDVASIDSSIAMSISELAFRRSHTVKTHTARSLQLGDFKVDDDFIVLGSPRSNPWFDLFDDQLDFRFEHDPGIKQEVIRNAHVRDGEAAMYIPTAQGWETGNAYAIIGFIRNPGQNGHVLLIAGSNAEATEAAGKFITNVTVLSAVLREHGLRPNGPPEPFEILLRASIMAGSSNTFQIVALHKLAPRSGG